MFKAWSETFDEALSLEERVRLAEAASGEKTSESRGVVSAGRVLRPQGPTPVVNLSPRLQILDRQLGDKPYLSGEAFTIADAYAFVILSWAKRLNIDITSWPRLEAFRERVAARPAVRGVLSEEGLA